MFGVFIYIYIYIYNIYICTGSEFCAQKPDIRGGIFDEVGKSPGSTSNLTCMPPYLLSGTPVYICGFDGQWHGSGLCCKF